MWYWRRTGKAKRSVTNADVLDVKKKRGHFYTIFCTEKPIGLDIFQEIIAFFMKPLKR